MSIEQTISAWATQTTFSDLPDDVVELTKSLIFVIAGCTVAGATADGCEEVVDLVRTWGGAEQATILVHGGKVPAHSAVLANSVMARAHDICDFVAPGIHLGTSVVPVAFAVAEAIGGCTGEELVAAIAVGNELGARFAKVSHVDGFDPSGVGTVFAATATAAKLLKLDSTQMLNALGIAFNRLAGSFQSNIDAALAIRLIQGFSSQSGVQSAELAARGLTGPANFVNGVWGYYHLYCKERDDDGLAGDLGERWTVRGMGFKNYPSCGATGPATDAALALTSKIALDTSEVASIVVRMASESRYLLVGHKFQIGEYPTVNGQFTVSYCVANALLRGFPVLDHFTAEMVTDPAVLSLIDKVTVMYDPALADGKYFSRASVDITMTDGTVHTETANTFVGMPPLSLTRERLIADYWARSGFGGKPIAHEHLESFLFNVDNLEYVGDVRTLIPLLVAQDSPIPVG